MSRDAIARYGFYATSLLCFILAQSTTSLAATAMEPVAPGMRQTAECMATVMRTTPGTQNVRVGALRDQYGYIASIEYAYRDTAGKRRVVHINLRHEVEDGYYFYPAPSDFLHGGPMTDKVHDALLSKCRARALLEIE